MDNNINTPPSSTLEHFQAYTKEITERESNHEYVKKLKKELEDCERDIFNSRYNIRTIKREIYALEAKVKEYEANIDCCKKVLKDIREELNTAEQETLPAEDFRENLEKQEHLWKTENPILKSRPKK